MAPGLRATQFFTASSPAITRGGLPLPVNLSLDQWRLTCEQPSLEQGSHAGVGCVPWHVGAVDVVVAQRDDRDLQLSAHGQGHQTSFAMLVSELRRLGAPKARLRPPEARPLSTARPPPGAGPPTGAPSRDAPR